VSGIFQFALFLSLIPGIAQAQSQGDTDFIFLDEEDDGRFIRGVPNLDQYPVDISFGKTAAVGCGPLAVAELMIWYASIGYPELASNHENSAGRIQWKDLTDDLRDRLPTSTLFSDGGTSIDPGQKMADAIEDYIEDQGYSATVQWDIAKDGDEKKSLKVVKSYINNGKPVLIAFDTGDKDTLHTEVGYDHMALVVGYEDDQVLINMGNGRGDNQWYKWDFDGGKVFTMVVQMDSMRYTDETWCAHDDGLSAHLTDTSGMGYTTQSSDYDDYAMAYHLAGEGCGVLSNADFLTIDVDTPVQDVTYYAGAKARVTVSSEAGQGGWNIDDISVYMVDDKGYLPLHSEALNIPLTEWNDSTSFEVQIPADTEPGTYRFLISAAFNQDGYSDVLQDSSATFTVEAPLVVSEVHFGESVYQFDETRSSSASVAAANSYWVQPGAGNYEISLQNHTSGNLNIDIYEEDGETLLESASLTTADGPYTYKWETTDIDQALLLTVGFDQSVNTGLYRLDIKGESVITLEDNLPFGGTDTCFGSELGLTAGETADFAFRIPSYTIASVHVQSQVSKYIRGRRATEADSKNGFPEVESRPTEPAGPGVNHESGYLSGGETGYEIAVLDSDGSEILSSAVSNHHDETEVVVVWNEEGASNTTTFPGFGGILPNGSSTEYLLRVTKLGSETAGFCLRIEHNAESSLTEAGLWDTAIDETSFYNKEYFHQTTLSNSIKVTTYQVVVVPANHEFQAEFDDIIDWDGNGYTGNVRMSVFMDFDIQSPTDTINSEDGGVLSVSRSRAERTLIVQIQGQSLDLDSTNNHIDVATLFTLVENE
jgi:hypothetical protein